MSLYNIHRAIPRSNVGGGGRTPNKNLSIDTLKHNRYLDL